MMINEVLGTGIHCPICKKFLVEAGEGTNIGITCEKCHKKYVIEIKDGMLSFSQVLQPSDGECYPYVCVRTQKPNKKIRQKSQTSIAI